MKKMLSVILAALMILSTLMSVPAFAAAENDYEGYIVLPFSQLTLEMGEAYQLEAEVNPEQAISWSSDDDSIATVTDEGLIAAVSEGATTITATAVDDGFSESMEVVIVSSLYLNLPVSELTLEVGEGYQLEAENLYSKKSRKRGKN